MTKFTHNFYLDIRKPLKSGLFSIKVNLYDVNLKKTTNFTIKRVGSTEVSSSKDDWASIWSDKNKYDNFGNVKGEKTVYGRKLEIRTILKVKEDNLDEIISRQDVLTSEDVKREFNAYTPPVTFTNDIYIALRQYKDKLDSQERFKYAKTIRTTLNNIKKFNNNRPFGFSSLTVDWCNDYDRARRKQGIAVSSIGIDMRNLRTVFNIAIKDNPTLKTIYPFGADRYIIPTGDSKNVGLSKDDLVKINNFSSDNVNLQKARDIFLFSYFAGGMNYKDLIQLKKGQTNYIRSKTKFTTKKEVKIPFELNDTQREIVSRYEGKGKYLFNFLKDNATEREIFEEQTNGLSSFDKQIKKLSKRLGIPKISYQWARHSFATNLRRADVPVEAIQESMGHTDKATTQKYIDSLYDENKENIKDALDL